MKPKSLLIGIGTYLATHAVLVALWPVWGAQHEPWFLNDRRAVLLTSGCLCLAALGAAARWARTQYEAIQHGANVACGALVGMIAMVFIVGPGSIFPIVIAFAFMITLVSTFVGATIVAAFK